MKPIINVEMAEGADDIANFIKNDEKLKKYAFLISILEDNGSNNFGNKYTSGSIFEIAKKGNDDIGDYIEIIARSLTNIAMILHRNYGFSKRDLYEIIDKFTDSEIVDNDFMPIIDKNLLN